MTAEAPHVAILGAGPGGIATAVGLARRNIACTLLERGACPAAAMRGLDPEMELLSPSRLSLIEGMVHESGDPTYPRFSAYADKLDRIVDENQLKVVTGSDVTRVEQTAQGFRVTTAAGATLDATHVVNATGISSQPVLPEAFDPSAAGYRWLHSVGVRTTDLEASRRLLVIGGGQSAVEILERWLDVRRSDDRAWLSLRREAPAVPHRLLGIDFHYLIWPFEFLPTRWLPLNPAGFRDPAVGFVTRRARKAGTIEDVPAIARYAGGGVAVTNGAALEPDLVVFATGFRYALEHLKSVIEVDARGWPQVVGCESRRVPGLYLLGLRQCRSLASAYLRGIARDARAIVARIAA